MPIYSATELDTNRPRILLDGRWRFSYDPHERGEEEEWFRPEHRFPEWEMVPGCPQRRRHASAENRSKETITGGLPECDAPGIMLRHRCTFDNWWQTSFDLPEWKGGEIWLHVGGVLSVGTFWLNGKRLGETRTSRTAIRIPLSRHANRGGKNVLTVKISWPHLRLDGCYSATGWSGLYRSIWVEHTPHTHLVDLHVLPSINPPRARICAKWRGRTSNKPPLDIAVKITPENMDGQTYTGKGVPHTDGKSAVIDLNMPGARHWDIGAPHLYRATVTLLKNGEILDTASVRFGLREISTEGYRILLNGVPVFLRGACDDVLYPETIIPPPDKGFHAERIARAQAYGFNYTKSCVEVFFREYLDAADELGFLVCQEMPFGLHSDLREQRHTPTPAFEKLWQQELEHIIRASRNHPSVIAYSMASELSNPWIENKTCFRIFSRDLPKRVRALAPNALVVDITGASQGAVLGTEAVPVRTKRGVRDTDLQGSWLGWGHGCRPLLGPIPGLKPVSLPYIFHEYAWLTSLSDPKGVERFKRLPFLPLHIPEMIAAARRNGQAKILPRMIECSRKLKYALRKHAFELARREPKAAGIHHWLIHDFPFCAEGVFDEFWNPPNDLPAGEFLRYNADTILCLNDNGKRCYQEEETPPVSVTISHFGPEPLQRPRLCWRLRQNGKAIAHGKVSVDTIGCGMLVETPSLPMAFPKKRTPAIYRLEVILEDGNKHIAENEWALWTFPSHTKNRALRNVFVQNNELHNILPDATVISDADIAHASGGVMIANHLTDALLSFLTNGGRVLLLDTNLEVGNGALPKGRGHRYYRTVPYNDGIDGNMGTVIRTHPALGKTPHEGWADFLWEPLLDDAPTLVLSPYSPARIDPIIRSIGHMRTMEDKAYLFDADVGKGRLLACSMKLAEKHATHPLAAYLLDCFIRTLQAKTLPSAARIKPTCLAASRTQ